MDLSLLDAVGGVRVVALVAGGIFGLMVMTWLMKPKATQGKATQRQCSSCGWTGSIVAYKPKCPRCGNTL